MKPDARWRDVSERDLTRAIDAAETIFVCVPFTRGADALWLDVTREQAEKFASEAHGLGLRVHTQWDGAALMIGGGSAIRPGATIPARPESRA